MEIKSYLLAGLKSICEEETNVSRGIQNHETCLNGLRDRLQFAQMQKTAMIAQIAKDAGVSQDQVVVAEDGTPSIKS